MFESFWFCRGSAWQGTGRPRPPQSSQARRRGTPLVLEPVEARTLLTSYTAATVSDLIAAINAANAAGGESRRSQGPSLEPKADASAPPRGSGGPDRPSGP